MAPRGTQGILLTRRLVRLLSACCVMMLSVSLAAACGAHGSAGPSDGQPKGKSASLGSGGSTAEIHTYKRSASGIRIFTIPAGQGSAIGPPTTVVAGRVAWKFKQLVNFAHDGRQTFQDCPDCNNIREILFQSTSKLPLDMTIRITGAPAPTFQGSNQAPGGRTYCPKIKCGILLIFYPPRDGHWTVHLNIDNPHFHASYIMPAEASSFRGAASQVPN
jgi:hypothetical protein